MSKLGIILRAGAVLAGVVIIGTLIRLERNTRDRRNDPWADAIRLTP